MELATHWEHNLGESTVRDYPDLFDAKLTAPVYKRLNLVFDYENRAPADLPSTHQLLAGVEALAGKNLKAYSKYRMDRTGSRQRMGQVTGLEQRFWLKRNLSGALDIEMFRSISSAKDGEYFAFKTGLHWLRPKVSVLEGQYEYRWQRSMTKHVLQLNAVRQYGSLAFLFKNALALSYPDGKKTSVQTVGRVAGAYRPLASPLQTLFMVRNIYDRYSPVDPEAISWRLVFSNDINFFIAPAHELRLKLAYKRAEDYSAGISETTNNYLVLGQYVIHFARNWDIDLWARYVNQAGDGTTRLGSGAEIGRLFLKRVRVAAGYSLDGFEERDLAENDAWAKGFGLRVQLILSDWIFNEFGGNQGLRMNTEERE